MEQRVPKMVKTSAMLVPKKKQSAIKKPIYLFATIVLPSKQIP